MRVRPIVLAAFAAAILSALAAPARAGLWFRPVAGPSGADVRALSADGATLWAATYRGVWKLSAGAWSLDGLGDRAVTSVAVSGGAVWAATGDALYRRAADGSWSAEALPVPTMLPAVLAADGDTLWAGGASVAPGGATLLRRAGGSWTAPPSPGAGYPTALAPDAGGLLVGLSSGLVSRWNGSGFTTLGSYLGATEPVQAVLAFGGIVYAGTPRALYAWNGAAWQGDGALGMHDVRAISSAGGVLRVATFDAGVFRGGVGSWGADAAGVLTIRATAFAVLGSDLYLGTGGGPVYRRVGSGWSDAAPGSLNGAIVTDVIPDTIRGYGAVIASAGAGLVDGGGAALPLPDGCGDVSAVAPFPQDAGSVMAATNCGPVRTGPAGVSSVSTGLPGSVLVRRLAAAPDGSVEGGTTNAGLYRYAGSSWVADNSGLSSSAAVDTLRVLGSTLHAFAGGSLVARGTNGAWTEVNDGLPAGASVVSLGGDATASYAGLLAGGVHQRHAGSDWRWDSWGLLADPVNALAAVSGRLYAGAGTGGVLVRVDGGFRRESAGLPAGADVRVLGSGVDRGAPPRPGLPGPCCHYPLVVGTAGRGAYQAATYTSERTVPVVLDVVGGTGARFRTELTIGTGGGADGIDVDFTPAPGFDAGGTLTTQHAFVGVPMPKEIRIPDALAWLRSLGMTISAASASTPIAGTLTLSITNPLLHWSQPADDIVAIARTYTTGSGGTFGLFYDAPSDLDTAEESAAVYGLRSVSGLARSNLALVHIRGGGVDPITLSVQVMDAAGRASGAPIVRTLRPGEWTQINGVLDVAGLPDGSFGYAKITRTAGTGTWLAYGVVNDAATSDGSYLAMQRPGGLGAVRRQVIPVVLDVNGAAGSHYTTEVTLVNDGPIGTPVDLGFQPSSGAVTGLPRITVNVPARAQVTIPNVLQAFRDAGVGIPSADAGGAVGTLSVDFRQLVNLDFGTTLALARTTTPNNDEATGGAFGLFYPAVARGGGSRASATVPALRQDVAARSNVAVVHVHGGSDVPMAVRLQLHDAATGAAVGSVLTATLSPGEWKQWSSVMTLAGVPAAVTNAYAVVTRTSGDDTFFAYGVVNDAVTSDGSYVAMVPADRY